MDIMKIAFIVDSFPQVSETFIARQARLLDADIVCRTPNYALPSDFHGSFRIVCLSRARPWLRAKERIRGSWAKPLIKCALRPLLSLRSVGKRAVAQYSVDMLSLGEDAEKRWGRYLDRRRPDVVLAHWAPIGLAAINACRDRQIPLVVHFHGYDASTLMRYEWYRSRIPVLFEQAGAVVCVSSSMSEVLRRAGCPPEKLHVIPCGAPIRDFRLSEAVLRQPCRFTAVSRLVPGKGPLVTLEAFRRVHERRSSVHLTFVGDGPLRDDMSRFIAQHQLQESVSMVGSVPFSAVNGLLAESAVFVQASLTDETGCVEGWGVSLAEALSAGLPAVVTRSGGMTDLVKDGWNGFLFEEGDAQGMAESMLRLADDPRLRFEMGMRGRKHVEDVGDAEKNAQRLAAVLRTACSRAWNRGVTGPSPCGWRSKGILGLFLTRSRVAHPAGLPSRDEK
jgi:glycosyltransferase involved in cell wall biosynthesis